jgi:hypothetical protein
VVLGSVFGLLVIAVILAKPDGVVASPTPVLIFFRTVPVATSRIYR